MLTVNYLKKTVGFCGDGHIFYKDIWQSGWYAMSWMNDAGIGADVKQDMIGVSESGNDRRA